MSSPNFQRRQYDTLASAYASSMASLPVDDYAARVVLNSAIDRLAPSLRRDNPAFDRFKFRDAAGYDYNAGARLESQKRDERRRIADAQYVTRQRDLARAQARANRRPRPQMTDGLTGDALVRAIRDIARSARTNGGIKAMQERRAEFASGPEMILAGIAMLPESRAMLNRRLDEAWAAYREAYFQYRGDGYNRDIVPEVIIGAGVHAAAYCSARVAAGYPKPLVLERSTRVGGAFAVSEAPSFYLNSRNRPGLPGLPNRGQALNVILGAPVQMAALSGLQFQPNTDMSYVVRCALAENARVLVNAEVTGCESTGNGTFSIYLASGEAFKARRVIDARGLGDSNAAGVADGKRIMTFQQFAARMDTAFPLRGMRRIAVLGAGDSAFCTVEAAMGSGPDGSRIVTALDYVESVDLYGPGLPRDCDSWRKTQRGRYQDIAGYLPTPVRDVRPTDTFDNRGNRVYAATSSGKPARVNVFDRRAACTPTTGAVIVGTNTYDMAVLATGNTLKDIPGAPSRMSQFRPADSDDAEPIATRDRYDTEYYRVGPAAELPFSSAEERTGIAVIAANRVAMFRLTPRTAALATTLPQPRGAA